MKDTKTFKAEITRAARAADEHELLALIAEVLVDIRDAIRLKQ